ncbi:MAG TPA: HD domain-containing phosphohydrolase [Ktedonobacterales bacterium]|jgi:putative two-component system response regulator|nr:HD domain-containing phosphohydrolase [Ktedonobacterales bacterium]
MIRIMDAAPGTRRHTRQVIYELAESIRERDQVTYDHCRRVAIYVNRLARFAGWPRAAARELALAGLVHDLGKTWAPNEVLLKPAALTESEREMIEKHPVTAAQLLWAFDMPDAILDAVLSHHERWDGRGYPKKLVRDEIPLGARLLSVSDVFDVITTPRPYKAAMSVEAARERVLEGAGSAFDPEVTEIFTRLLDARPDFLLWAQPLPIDPAAHDAWSAHDSGE